MSSVLEQALSIIDFNERVLECSRQKEQIFSSIQFLSIVESNMTELFHVRLPQLKKDEMLSVFNYARPLWAQLELRTKEVSDCLTHPHLMHFTWEENSLNEETHNAFLAIKSNLKIFFFNPTEKMFIKRMPKIDYSLTLPFLAFSLSDGQIAFVLTEGLPTLIEIKKINLKEELPAIITLYDLITLYGKDLFNEEPLECALVRAVETSPQTVDNRISTTNTAGTIRDEAYQKSINKILKEKQTFIALFFSLKKEQTQKTSHGANKSALKEFLQKFFALDKSAIFETPCSKSQRSKSQRSPMELSTLMELESFAPIKDRRKVWPHYKSSYQNLTNDLYWEDLKKQDRLLNLPYEDFSAIIDFVHRAANDDKTKSIKMTLYRAGEKSSILSSLIAAKRTSKKISITVFIEIRARGDEETNILWAQRLKDTGIKVVYGFPGYKLHAKAILLTREDGRFVHLGTGNYNEITGRLYSDLSLFSAREALTDSVSNFFNMIENGTLLSQAGKITGVLFSPVTLKKELLSLIERESHPNGLVRAKMNGLTDDELINALIKAAAAGGKVFLNVRGICLIEPQEGLVVRSIVGHYLEHSRIFSFGSGAEEKIFLSSADWMERNTEKRVELMFPILDRKIARRVRSILDLYFHDNTSSWELISKNERSSSKSPWARLHSKENEKSISCQKGLLSRERGRTYRESKARGKAEN